MSLEKLYKTEVMPKLKEQLGYSNDLAVPRITKVVINVGVGKHSKEKAYIEHVVKTLTSISGQKPITTKARKSIATFKVREGMIVGVVVNLRGKRMYDFVEKLVNVTLPRVRDFRGLSPKIVDRTGNASIGFKEHIAFPEIGSEDLENIHGLEVNITTSAKNKEEGLSLLTLLGFPFKKEAKK